MRLRFRRRCTINATKPPTERPEPKQRVVRVTIEISPEDHEKLWTLIEENEWSGRHFGENYFVMTEDQLAVVRKAGLYFQTV
jgi:hypothetical protein